MPAAMVSFLVLGADSWLINMIIGTTIVGFFAPSKGTRRVSGFA